jgi:5'-nucleotidase
MSKKPLILLSNDDGYEAKGLVSLIEIIRSCGDLVVVAPDSPRSGMSTAITVTTPLRIKLVSEEEGLKIFKSNGTPVDCVKLALNQILKDRKPDIVLSGINHGTNSSVAIHYSGTMGAVLEACMNGIPAIGFSLDDHSFDADFCPAGSYIKKITEEVLRNGLPSDFAGRLMAAGLRSSKNVSIRKAATTTGLPAISIMMSLLRLIQICLH